MTDYYYDLHIHSALSPCGDSDMTPNNVVHMAKICGLDIIALTDHNSAFNVSAFHDVACENDILLIPGIELNTMEDVHLLAYFDSVDSCCECGRFIYDSLPDITNNSGLFGNQYVFDELDNIIDEKSKLLLSALPFSFDECIHVIKSYHGIAVPAHVNKPSYSVIENLGFIPENSDFQTIEVCKELPFNCSEYPYNIIYSSDAHYLENINDAENTVALNCLSCKELLTVLSGAVMK